MRHRGGQGPHLAMCPYTPCGCEDRQGPPSAPTPVSEGLALNCESTALRCPSDSKVDTDLPTCGGPACGLVVNLSPFSTGNPLRHTWNRGKAGISLLSVTLRYVTVQTTWLAPGEGIRACPARRILRGGHHRLLSQPVWRPRGALGGVTGEQRLKGKQGQRNGCSTCD